RSARRSHAPRARARTRPARPLGRRRARRARRRGDPGRLLRGVSRAARDGGERQAAPRPPRRGADRRAVRVRGRRRPAARGARAGEGACAEAPPALVLAATDPANPFGVLLPWPPSRVPEARPRRAAGAAVVLVDGLPALFLDRGGRQATTFAAAHDEPGALDAA